MSLSKCLKQAGLSKHEAAILRGNTKQHVEDGVVAQEAAILAVQEHLDTLIAERADIVSQIEAQGGVVKQEAPPEAVAPVETALSPEPPRVADEQPAAVAAPGREDGLPDVPDTMFSRKSEPMSGNLSLDETIAFANDTVGKWANKPELFVTERPSQWGFEAPSDARGAWRDKLYLASSNHSTVEDLQVTIFHESFGHMGFAGMGVDHQAFNQLWSANPKIRQATSKWFSDNSDVIQSQKMTPPQAKLRAIEEALADMAGRGQKVNGLKQFLATVQRWLRSVGLNSIADQMERYSDAEALDLLSRARQWVEQGEGKTAQILTEESVPAMHRAFHGSPHDFDQFSMQKIGTGEGAQAYGWGMYFSGRREVAEFYKKKLSAPTLELNRLTGTKDGRTLTGMEFLPEYFKPGRIVKGYGGLDEVVSFQGENSNRFWSVTVKEVKDQFGSVPNKYDARPRRHSTRPEPMEVRKVLEAEGWTFPSGRLYEVELAPKEDEYLDWDKPLSEQSEVIRNALIPLVDKARTAIGGANAISNGADRVGDLRGGDAYRILTSYQGTMGGDRVSAFTGKYEGSAQAAVSAKLSDLGIPGIRYLDGSSRGAGEGHHNYVLFDDSLVKVEAKFSRQPDWVTNGSPELKSAAGKIDTFAPSATIHQKIQGLQVNWKNRLLQGAFDQFRPLRELSPRAYILARMTKSADAVLEGTLLYGKPVLDQDGAVVGDLDGKGFMGAMQELNGEHDRFLMWVAGNRSERLMKEDKEHLFTPAEITAMKGLNQGQMKDGTSRQQAYQTALDTFRAYNKAVMDLAEETGLIDGAARHLWEHDFYVPFYRTMEDDLISGPSKIKGLVRQQAFKKLKGGQEPLGDLMANTLRNWSHLISASLANQAAVESLVEAERIGIAHQVPAGTKGSTFAMIAGKETHFIVDDPMVLTAISAMSAIDFKGPAMKVMRDFKRMLTLGVTVSPPFRAKNLMRDSISAVGVNKISYNIPGNIAKGFKGTKKGSVDYAKLLFGGGMMRFGTYLEGDRAANVKRLINAGVDDSTILNTPQKIKAAAGKLWDMYQEFGDRMENINRSALYQQLIAEGKTHLEASFAARDMLDFSMQGSFMAIRFLSQVVPFFNARMQGLYKMGRAYKEDKMRLGYVSGAVAMTSIALMLAYEDDDDWKAREDWDRDSNWWFKIGEQAYRIPKPFEIGAIGTLAERGWEYAFNEDMTGKRLFERMRFLLLQTFAMNPVPQLFKPMIDIYANEDSFTGRQIESRGMENLSKAERMRANTSLVAQVAGSVGNVTDLSPVQVDHLIRAYFGWLGTHVAMTVDLMAEPFSENEKPTRRIGDMFVVGDFVKGLPQDQSRYVEMFYKQAKEVHEVMNDIKNSREIGDMEKAEKILEENKDKVGLSKLYFDAEKEMGKINKEIRLVQSRSSMTGDEKREQLNELTAMRNQLAKLVNEKSVEARR